MPENIYPAQIVGPQSYDAVPYHGQPFRQMHPASLGAIAHLVGLSAPRAETCRVLELGCCDGGNLMPMADEMPGATFVGIDYSAKQIERGRERIGRLGLKNIDLRAESILDITPDLGQFDYILCHGVFSWVPNDVRDKILDVSKKHLSPDGIAYISYNAYPGWHLRSIVRDMMRYHALRFPLLHQQTDEARLILDFVSNFASGQNTEGYGVFLKSEADLLKKLPDHYLFHEHLEEHCNPYYFKDFIAMARKVGLDYLSESRLAAMAPNNFGKEAERALAAIATNVIELEQFMDFLRSRTFRETLLHHEGRTPDYTLQPKSLGGLYIASSLRPKQQPMDLRPGTEQAFETLGKYSVSSANPVVKIAFYCLAKAYPASIEFDELFEQALGQLQKHKVTFGPRDKEREAALGRVLLTLFTSSDAIELRTTPSAFVTSLSEKSVASPYARSQVKDYEPITTRRHEQVPLDEDARAILELLDGSRSLSDVAKSLDGKLDEAKVRQEVERFARFALLVG